MGDESHDFVSADERQGPSWQRPDWRAADPAFADDLTRALDPTAMAAAITAAVTKPGAPAAAPTDAQAIESAAADSIRAMMLIRTYRVRGHLAANLDPLGLSDRKSTRLNSSHRH